MPIQVACTSCAGRFRVPDNVAGKKIRCPKCKEVINVPAADGAPAAPATTSTPKPTPSASQPKPATPPTSKPTTPAASKPAKPALENWFLKAEDGESYGPVPRAELDAWYAEGRVTIDCQVLREGSEQWQWASELYPELDPASAAKVVPTTPDVAAAPVTNPEPVAAKPEPAPVVEPAPKKDKVEPAPAKPAATTTSAPKKKPEAPAPSFFPVETAAETPAASSDDPFAFLGGSGETGGEAFNFSAAPSTAPTTAKGAKKAVTKTATPATTAADNDDAANTGEVSSKSKLTAGLLAIFLGSLGVHRFYLGYTMLGVIQLLLCGGCGIWQIIDIVMIFTGKLPDAQGRPLKG